MLRIPEPLLLQVLAHCEDGYPAECCGAFLGRVRDGERAVEEAHPLTNVNRERPRDRYEADPRELLALERKARENALSVVGFYHSHPDHPERPSATDTERAWPGYSYLIVSVREGRATGWRSWVLEEDPRRFVEEPITGSAA
jgi:proteasome lid subunit RPN8/RPN11